ncbi:MAG: hypothetical protein AAGD25_14885 [Cyanobacteria bacterium P01_F01_bin.150]
MTELTIELPDPLAEKLDRYFHTHPDKTLVSLIHEALEIKLMPKNTSQLLKLAGIVTDAPRGAADHAEDFG